MSFDTWTKKHTERLYELLDESVIDPLNKDDEHLTDVFNHLEEDDLMKGVVGVTKFHSLLIVPFCVCLAPSSFPRTNEEMIRDVVDERTTARMKEQERRGKVHD